MRLFTYMVTFTTVSDHKETTVEDNPFISIPSLIGYKILLLTGQLLILDQQTRKSKSYFSQVFENETKYTSFLALLMNCKVPSDVSLSLEQLAPIKDPLRPDLELIPLLACFSLEHDFGRTVPAFIYFMMHETIARHTDGESAQDIMQSI